MVRLKLREIENTYREEPMSQFHYGSIKTNINGFLTSRISSLNSTMVRLKRKCRILNSTKIACLNSTMVRLKPLKILLLNENERCLNSTMVRLKHNISLNKEKNIIESQFHYGSIKTNPRPSFRVFGSLSQFHYGSIKTIIIISYITKKISSQFHYGSIKTEIMVPAL